MLGASFKVEETIRVWRGPRDRLNPTPHQKPFAKSPTFFKLQRQTQILTIRTSTILLEDCHHVENHSRYVKTMPHTLRLLAHFHRHRAASLTILPQPECVPTSNNSLSTPSRPRRETSSRPSSSRSASRTMTLNVTSVSPEPSVSQSSPAQA